MAQDQNHLPLIERVEDYVNQPVPYDLRKGPWAQFIIWSGWAIWPGSLLVGGAVGAGLTLGSSIAAIIIGSLILVVLHFLLGRIGSQTGMSTPIIAINSWGQYGRIIPAVLYAVTLWGWFGVVTGFAGSMFQSVFGAGAIWLWALIFGILFTLAAIYGFRGLAIVSQLGSPLIVIICIWSFFAAVSKSGGWASLAAIHPAGSISFGVAVGITIANWAAATTACPDFYRYARDNKSVFSGAVGGMLVGNAFTMIIGAILALGVKNPDIIAVMKELNLIWVAAIFIIFGVWTSAQTNVYVSSLALANIFKTRRLYMALLCGLIGTILAATGIYAKFINFLTVLGVIFPGIIGIFIVDYWIFNRGHYGSEILAIKHKSLKWSAVIAWVVSMLVEYYFGKAGIGIQVLNGIIVGCVSYLIFRPIEFKTAIADQKQSLS